MCHAEISFYNQQQMNEVTKLASAISWDNDCDFLLKSKSSAENGGRASLLSICSFIGLLWRTSLIGNTVKQCLWLLFTLIHKSEVKARDYSAKQNVLACRTMEILVWTLFLIQIFIFVPHPFSFALFLSFFLSFFHSISVSQLHSTAVSEGHGVDMSCSELQAT